MASHMIASHLSSYVLYALSCQMRHVLWVCVVVYGSGVSAPVTNSCVCICGPLCALNVSDNKQVSLSKKPKQHIEPTGGTEGRSHSMGEAVQANNRLAAQQE